MSDINQTSAWTAGNPALWERLEAINPESYADVRSAWEAQDPERTLFALWDYMNPEADPYKGISSIIEAYGSRTVLLELGVPQDQAEQVTDVDPMKSREIEVPDVSLGDALEQGVEFVVGGFEAEEDPGMDEVDLSHSMERPFEPPEEYDPDPADGPVIDFTAEPDEPDDTDMREEPDVTSEQAAGENPDRIDSDTVELFVKDVLGEDGAKEIEEILKEALSAEEYQKFLDVCNQAKEAKDDGRPADEVSQIIRDWAKEQKAERDDTEKQDTAADDPMRERYIEKMDEARQKKSEQLPYYRDTFFTYYDMKEKYYAMKAGVPIDGKPVSRTDFTMSVMRFLNTNIYESLLLRLIDKYDSKKEKDNAPDVDRYQEDRNARDMGAKDDIGAHDNGYASGVDRSEADAARSMGHPEYGQFMGANTAGDTDKRFSREDRTVWNTKPLIEFAPRIGMESWGSSRVQRIPEMRTVEFEKNFYLVNPFGKVEASKIYHPDSVAKSFPDMDVTRRNESLVSRMSETAADRGLTLDQYKAEIEIRCKEAFAGRIEAQWDGESQRLGSLAESIRGDIGSIKEQLKNLDAQEQKVETGKMSDLDREKAISEISDVRKGLEAGLEKAQTRLDNVEKYKDYIDAAKDAASRSDIDSRFSRAATGESMAAGRAENVEYVSADTNARYEQVMEINPNGQEVEKDSDKTEMEPDHDPAGKDDHEERPGQDVDRNDEENGGDTAAADEDQRGDDVETGTKDDAKSEQDDSAPAESEEGAVDMEDAGEDPAMIEAGKKDRDDPEEEKIADVGAAADEEEALIEAGQEKGESEPDKDNIDRNSDDADGHDAPDADVAGEERAGSDVEKGDTAEAGQDAHKGEIDRIVDTIRDFIDDKAEFIDVLETIRGIDPKEILHDLAEKFLPEDAVEKIDGIVDLMFDIHDLFSVPLNDLFESFLDGFGALSAEESNAISDAFDSSLAESIENREAFEGIISIGEQPFGFGEETGIVDLHTGDNVDGLDADGAIENLINDVAHETDQFLNDVDRSNVPEIETGSDIDPVSAEEIGGQGLGKGNDLASEDMNIDGFIPESMENPIAQTAVEDISGSAEIEEALALLL